MCRCPGDLDRNMKTPSQKGKSSRDKGQRGEREVCSILRSAGYRAKRGWQSRDGGKGESDVVTDFPFRPEVKFQETLNIYAAIDQVNNDNSGTVPNCIVFKKSRGEWWAAIPFQDLIRLCIHMPETAIKYE